MMLDKTEKEEKLCMDPSELSEVGDFTGSLGNSCWRDRQLVRKLVQLRLDAIGPQWKKSKQLLSQKLRDMAAVLPRDKMKTVWAEVQTTRRRVE